MINLSMEEYGPVIFIMPDLRAKDLRPFEAKKRSHKLLSTKMNKHSFSMICVLLTQAKSNVLVPVKAILESTNRIIESSSLQS